MRISVLTIVFILIVVIGFLVRRGKDSYARDEEAFWDRERRANTIRKKPLDDVVFIEVPLDRLPMDVCADDEHIAEYIATIRDLAGTRIVNLTGISNTDLKFKYGTGNLGTLSVADQRYTLLVSTLQRWAEALYESGERDAARVILEYAVETGTDVSGTYRLLSSMYAESGDKASIRGLIALAETLNTPLRASIVDSLNATLNRV